MREPDPEAWYHVGELLGYCGRQDAAIRLLRGAIEQNYCAYETLQTEPLLVKLRGTPEVQQIAIGSERVPEKVLGAARPQSTMKDADPDIPIREAGQSGVREAA